MARILDDDRRAHRAQADGRPAGEPLRKINDPVAVLLQPSATARAVDDDRRVAGHRRETAPRQPRRLLGTAGMYVQGTTTIGLGTGHGDTRAGRPHEPGRISVS